MPKRPARGRSVASAVTIGGLLAVVIAGPVLAQDPGTDADGNVVAVGTPPPPPPPTSMVVAVGQPPVPPPVEPTVEPPTTTLVAVGQPPVPPPAPPVEPPTTTVVAVGQPPVPPPAVTNLPATPISGPVVERPAAVDLVGDTARHIAASIDRIAAHL